MKVAWLTGTLLLLLCVQTAQASLCHAGWVAWQYSCYLFNTGLAVHTWSDSRTRCIAQDADLLRIDSTQERDWVIGQTNRYRRTVQDWWIGLNALPDGTTWQWPNSTSSDISMLAHRWATGQPNATRTKMCVEIKNNRFTVQDCSLALHAICERPLGKPLTCDPNWKLDSGLCYYYNGGSQDYNGASHTCKNYGATLAQVYDLSTQKAVWEQASANRHAVWIGLRSVQQGTGYQWIWPNGSALTHGYWGKNPPATLGSRVNSTCVQQSLGHVQLQSWTPLPCNTRLPFLCQKPQGTCPSGWLQFTNRCFNIYTRTPKSFSDAQNFCSGLGANLLTFDTSDLIHFLWPYVRDARAAGAYSLWIGLTDYNQNDGPWTWVANNKTVSWQNWPPDTKPNTPDVQDCVSIDSSDNGLKWRSMGNCAAQNTFICQLPVNKALQHPTLPPKHYSCPAGFKLYAPAGTCLQLNQHDRTWQDARVDCRKHGADLVTIPSGRVNNYIRSQIQAHLGKYWIGLNDRGNEGQHRWLDSAAKPRYFNWHHGQPSNSGGNQNCVAIFPQDNYRWWDAPCGTKYNYICQTDALLNGVTQAPTTPQAWSPKCGPFWEPDPNSDSCYMFVTDRLSWLDARDACQTYHGDLASVNSRIEQSYLNGRVSTLESNFFWVGANDRQSENGWRWTDNSPMAYINWRPQEPNNQGNSDCGAISGVDGRWSDFPCTARYGYICEKRASGVTPTPTPPVTTPAHLPSGKVWGCGRGWRGFHGQCYSFLHTKAVTWTSARTGCAQQRAALVSVHSAAENDFVFGLVPRNYHGRTWLGLNDVKREGSFEWSDMSPVTFTLWSPREPNNNNNADCVATYNSKSWGDYSCNTDQVDAYICKKPMGIQDAADIALKQGCSSGLGYRAQCYVFMATPLRNWQSAQADCRRRHGNLATVNDRHVQAFLSAEMLNRGSPYWIGLKNVGPANKTYMWSSNYAVDFTFWAMNHTGNEMGTCVTMLSGRNLGLWQNYLCGQRMPYICELPRRGFTTPPPTTPTTVGRVPCPDGWVSMDVQCVKAFNVTLSQRLSWMESRAYCRSFGGDLLDIPSKDTETWLITQVFNNVYSGDWWIGLNDRDSENGHVWSDGKGVTYTNWLPGEPNDYNNREDCVLWHFSSGGGNSTQGWRDSNCYVARRFICSMERRKHQKITTTTVPPTGVTSKLCPSNGTWLLFKERCYFISPQKGPNAKLNWYQARRVCHSMNTEMVSVHGTDENGFLTTAMSRRYRKNFWLGLNDLSESGYSWTDGSPVDFVSWDINQPNDAFGGESCVQSNSQGVWNDKNCMDTNGYMCKELPQGVTTSRPTLPPVSGGCPRGYTSAPFLEKCYRVGGLTNTTRLNFTEAINFCKHQPSPGTLLSVHYYLEQKYVTSLIGHLPHPVWTGLNDIKKRNYFEWHDNTEVDFTHWGPGQPDENLHSDDPADRRDCVAMNTRQDGAGNWNDMDCGTKNHFICQVKRDPTLPALKPQSTGCKAGYSRQMKRCYKYFATPKSWTQAQATCQQDGGTLATPSDRFQKNVVGLLRVPDRRHAQNISDIWIGLHSAGNYQFQWVNRWPVRYTSWASEEPDNTGQCVKMDAGFYWHDHPCGSTYPFVCQLGGSPKPTVPMPVKGLCDDGWSPHTQYCYRLVTNSPRSWPGARYACKQLGAALVSVHSKDEMDFINSMVVKTSGQGVSSQGSIWLGLSKAADNGFAWSDDTEVEFVYWDLGEPSDSDRGQHQDCVQWSVSTGKWNDVDCFSLNYYMCKTQQVAVASSAQKQTGSNSGLSSGAVAGIAVGAAIIIAIGVFAGILLHGRIAGRVLLPSSRGGGVDNALYIKDGAAADDKDTVTFGTSAENSES